jgi:hypothetical protein
LATFHFRGHRYLCHICQKIRRMRKCTFLPNIYFLTESEHAVFGFGSADIIAFCHFQESSPFNLYVSLGLI